MKALKALARALDRGKINWPWQSSLPEEKDVTDELPRGTRCQPRKRPNRRAGLLAGLILAAAPSVGPSPLQAGTFENANRAFAEGRYTESVHGYKTVIAESGYSAPVLFNLGNAYARQGQLGPAILYYERGQVLAPADADIAANLALARKQAALIVEKRSWMESAAQLFSLNGWSCLGSTALTALCVGLLAARHLRKNHLSLRLLNTASACVFLASCVALTVGSWVLDRAVVSAPEAAVLLSPFAGAEPVYRLPAGEPLRIKRPHGDFLYVKNRAGRDGWVSKGEVARVIPS